MEILSFLYALISQEPEVVSGQMKTHFKEESSALLKIALSLIKNYHFPNYSRSKFS